tara:strand:- start:5999 stop:6220 length:222 start_codon:yes stop_codon:yes gene_type:complete
MSWYKIKILDKEINWASVLASGVIFIGLEVYRRKYIEDTIKKDIKFALTQISKTQENQAETKTLLDSLLDKIG